MLYLYFIEPRKVVVSVDKEAYIGREGLDVVVITNHGKYIVGSDVTVSRSHARIYLHESRYFIEDLGSLNGTYINGKIIEGWKPRVRSQPIELRVGDSVEVGVYTMFRIEAVEVEKPEESQRKDRCSVLLVLSNHIGDTLITLYRVKEHKEGVEKLQPLLKYILSKKVFRETIERFSADHVNSLEHHVNFISNDPTTYISDPQLVKGLQDLLEGIKKLIDSDYRSCII